MVQWLRRLLPIAAVVSATAATASRADDSRWLAILASQRTLTDAVQTAAALEAFGDLNILSSGDCRNLTPGLFLVAPGTRPTEAAARGELDAWQPRVPDAYLRLCKVAPNSLLALGVPLLDPTIAQRPNDTVNWGLDDAVSRLVALPDGMSLLIVPYYESVPNDVREGLRIRVSLLDTRNRPEVLTEDCLHPQPASSARFLALGCVTGAAGDYLTHSTYLYRLPSGEPVLRQDGCREPSVSDQALVCQAEQIGGDGQLRLAPRWLPLPQ